MARQGRAGAALGIAAFGSFIAGIFATFGIGLIGPSLAGVAIAFGPAEKSSLLVLGMLLVMHVSRTSFFRSLMMILVGLLLSTVGLDLISGQQRFTYDIPYLYNGFDIAIVAMGLFGISELLMLIERPQKAHQLIAQPRGLTALLPTRADWRASGGPIARGSMLGFFLGLFPGGGAMIASFASYVIEKRMSRHPEKFGTGVIEGVAGPESANNAAAQAAFIPLLCLGIPANAVLGVIMGALLIHGVTPGPELINSHPQLFWGVIASMFVGNLMLIILNVPLISAFVALLRVPAVLMAALIVVFCIIGAYSLNNDITDVFVMVTLGVLAYGLRKINLDPAPLLLAFVLGGLLERSVRQALLLGYGSPMIFIEKPISLGFVIAIALVLLWPIARWLLRRRGIVLATEIIE
jgi:putative tricarboxylic transport membrane protein